MLATVGLWAGSASAQFPFFGPYQWNQVSTGTYSWNVDANWTPQAGQVTGFPNETDAVANFDLNPTGAVTVNLGVNIQAISLNFTQTTTAASYTINGGASTLTLSGSGTPSINVANAGVTAIVNANINGGSGTTKTGAGTLVLGGTNNFINGGINVTGGILSISSTSNIGGGVTIDNATLRTTAGFNFGANVVTIGSNGGTIDVNVLARPVINTAGGLTGSGTLTRIASANNVTAGNGIATVNVFQVSVANAGFTGPVFLNGGQTQISDPGAFGTSTITINTGAELSTNVNIANPIVVNAGGSIGSVDANGIFSGSITLNGAVRVRLGDFYQNVSRNLTLSGNLTGSGTITAYNAATTVAPTVGAAQTLFLNGDNSAYTGTVNLPAGFNVSFASPISIPTAGAITINTNAQGLGGLGVGYDGIPTFTAASGGVFAINVTTFSQNLNSATMGGAGSNLFIGSNSTGTYNGTTLGAGSDGFYRLGGGGGTLTVPNAVLVGANGLLVGDARINGNGNVVLGGANTFTGTITIVNSNVTVSSIGGTGITSSNLGAGNGTLNFGSAAIGGTLTYIGTGETTDRVVNLAGTTGGATIDQSGAGLLKFGSLTASGIGAKTLTLQGSTAGTGEFSGTLNFPTLTLAKAGTGTWLLSGTGNTVTQVNAGGGILDIGTGGLIIVANPSGGNTLQATANTIINGTGNLSLSSGAGTDGGNVGAASGTTLTINPNIVMNSGAGAFELFSGTNSTGVTILNGINTYAGPTVINSGVLSVRVIGNQGSVTSNLGLGTTVNIGLGTNIGNTLRYTGSGEITNRIINLSASTGAGILDHSGTGLLRFTSNLAVAAGVKALTLQGSTAGTGEFAGVIANGSNTTGLNKLGTGTWFLTAINTYSGGTTIGTPTLGTSSGVLAVTNPRGLGATGSTVNFASSGTLRLASDTAFGGTNPVYNLSMTATTGQAAFTATIELDRATPGATTGITHNVGPFLMSLFGAPAGTLNVVRGINAPIGAVDSLAIPSISYGNTINVVETINATGVNLLIGTISPVPATASTIQGLVLGGTSTGNVVSGTISNNTTNLVTLNKAGGGTWTLTGTNTFTGLLQTTGGILNVASFSDYGVPSAIGARLASQESNVGENIGLHLRGGILQYTGVTPQSTNRQIRMLNSSTNTIDASGSSPTATLKFTYTGAVNPTTGVGTNTNLYENAGTRALVLTGTNTGDNSFSISLTNQDVNATSLTKNGIGTWILTGTSPITGATSVNAGSLLLGNGVSSVDGSQLTAGGLGATPVTVATGATFGVRRTAIGTNIVGGTLALNAGSGLTMADGFATTLTINGATASLAPASGLSTILTFDLDSTSGASDVLAITNAGSVGAARALIAVNAIGALTPGNTYNVITAGSGLTANFALLNPRVVSGNIAYPLTLTPTATAVTVGLGTGVFATAYYNGLGGSAALNALNGSTTNFSSDPSGSPDFGSQPTVLQDVVFAANSVSSGTPVTIASLGQDSVFNSLRFTAGAPAVTIGGTNTLTLYTGISNAGSNAQSVNVPLFLVAPQTISNTGTGLLTLGGNITAANNLLTFSGSGATTISGAAFSTSVGIIVTAGTGPLTISSTVALAATSIFSNASTNTITIGGVVSGGGGLTKLGTGTLSLTATNNTYTGTTLVSAGILNLTGNRAANNGTFSVGDTIGSTAIMNISGNQPAVNTFLVGTNASPTTVGIVNQTAGTVSLISNMLLLGNGGGGGSLGNGATGTYNLSGGTLSAGTSGLGVVLGVNAGNTGIFNLSGGTLSLGAATLQIARQNSSDASFSTGIFNQTGGTATIGTLYLASNTGGGNTNTVAYLMISGGTFTATSFPNPGGLASATNSTASITISGTAIVTLPAFPTTRGTGATAFLNFDGGTLRPTATSATYMSGLTRATLTANGAKIDTNSFDITIAQGFENAVGQTGTMTKLGAGTLTLSAVSSYTGNTTISTGTLALAATGSIANSNTIAVAAGATYNPSAIANYALAGGQTLTGGGTVVGSMNVSNSSTLRPGDANATGATATGLTLTTGAVNVANGSTLGFRLLGSANPGTSGASTNGLLGTQTTNTGFLLSGGSLLTGLTSNSAITITVDGTSTILSGGSSYSYLVAQGGSGQDFSGLNLLSTTNGGTATFNAVGFTNPTAFSLTGNSTGAVYLNFTAAVPEPSLLFGLAVGGFGLANIVRRRRTVQSV